MLWRVHTFFSPHCMKSNNNITQKTHYCSMWLQSIINVLFQQTMGQQQQVTLLQNEMDKLRSDNVKLYEKIRFLQSYPQVSDHN